VPSKKLTLRFEEGRDNAIRDRDEMKRESVLGSLVDQDDWVIARIWCDWGDCDDSQQAARSAALQIVAAVNGTAPEPRDGWPTDEHIARFGKWLAQEMPAGTVIGDPNWWPRKLLNAAYMYAAPPASKQPPSPDAVDAARYRFLRDKEGCKVLDEWLHGKHLDDAIDAELFGATSTKGEGCDHDGYRKCRKCGASLGEKL
jgi:hypothetical protein